MKSLALTIIVGFVTGLIGSPTASAQELQEVRVVLPAGASAQRPEEAEQKLSIGVRGVLAVPVGEFSDAVGLGGGVNLSVLTNPGGALGLRFDGSLLLYGHEEFTKPLSNTIQRVSVDVTTYNWIASLGAGPQLTLGSGPFRPYVFGTVGFSYFATVTSIAGSVAVSDEFASSTNFDDFTLSASGGAGLLIELSRGKTPVSLDLSVQGFRNGTVQYLRPGSIQERADGSVFFTPIESRADLVTIKAGVSIGVS